MTDIILSTVPTHVLQFSIGEDGAAFDVGSANPVTQEGVAFDLSKVDIDNASIVIDISNKTGTIDVDMTATLTYDGTNGSQAVTAANFVQNIAADGVTKIPLTDIIDKTTYQYDRYLTPTLTKNNTGTCDAKVYLVGQGKA